MSMLGSRKVDVVERMNTMDLNLPWYRAMAIAIVTRARQDWDTLNRTGEEIRHDNSGWCGRYEVEGFFKSGWCDALLVGTGYDAKKVKELNDGR